MLQQALQSGNYAQALELMAAGEKLPNNIDSFNKTQIFNNLLRAKAFNILTLMVKDKTIQTDVYEFDSFSRSIFASIAMYLSDDEASLDFFKKFITQFDNLNDEVEAQTLLGYFLEKGAHISSIKVLVSEGCNVNYKNNAEESFIHQVIKTNLMKPGLSTLYVQLLIDEGLDVNAANIVKKTPLIMAIEYNRKEYLDLLLQNGANPNETDKDGNSAFFYAAAQLMDIDIYKKLREYHQPNFEITNKDKVSMLFEFVRIMYDTSANNLELLRLLIEDGADLYENSIYYGKETTPLDMLAEKPVELLQTAIETGNVDINRQDNKGNTLLHNVCAYNVNYEQSKAKDTYKKVKVLLENGADASIINDKDETAMMLASTDNLKIKTVELLLSPKN